MECYLETRLSPFELYCACAMIFMIVNSIVLIEIRLMNKKVNWYFNAHFPMQYQVPGKGIIRTKWMFSYLWTTPYFLLSWKMKNLKKLEGNKQTTKQTNNETTTVYLWLQLQLSRQQWSIFRTGKILLTRLEKKGNHNENILQVRHLQSQHSQPHFHYIYIKCSPCK